MYFCKEKEKEKEKEYFTPKDKHNFPQINFQNGKENKKQVKIKQPAFQSWVRFPQFQFPLIL